VSNKIYGAIALTGGGTGALDAIDGTNLADKDAAIVSVQGVGIYNYIFNASSGATANGTSIIAPVTNAGNERWIIHTVPPTTPSYCVLTPKTADATLSATELAGNVLVTNTGASGAINLTQQAGTANYSITFEVTAAQYLKVTMAGSNKAQYYNTTGAAGGYVRSNVIGTRWTMTWNGVNWVISNLIGTLSYDE
jgi:hypothetical protein